MQFQNLILRISRRQPRRAVLAGQQQRFVEVASRYALLADEIGIVLAQWAPPVEAGLGMDGPVKVDGIGMLRGVGIDGHTAPDVEILRADEVATQPGLVDLAAHRRLLLPWFDLDPIDVHVITDIVAPALQQAAALGTVDPQFGQIGIRVAHGLEGGAALREGVLHAVEAGGTGAVRQIVAAGGLRRGTAKI